MSFVSKVADLLRLFLLEVESHFRMNTQRLEKLIQQGENEKVDFKLEYTKGAGAEIARDVSAMANSRGGDGYLIYGVDDPDRNHPVGDWRALVKGVDPGVLAESIVPDILKEYCRPVPRTSLLKMTCQGKFVDVLVIHRSRNKPHQIIKRGQWGKETRIRPGDIYIRRGSATDKATREEIAEMYREASMTWWRYGFATLALALVASVFFNWTLRDRLQRVKASLFPSISTIKARADEFDSVDEQSAFLEMAYGEAGPEDRQEIAELLYYAYKAKADEEMNRRSLVAYWYYQHAANAWEVAHPDQSISRPTPSQRVIINRWFRDYRFDLIAMGAIMTAWWWIPSPWNWVLPAGLVVVLARRVWRKRRKRSAEPVSPLTGDAIEKE